VELYGTHGTCKSRTTSIVKSKFRPGTRAGKAGTGIYFWAYDGSKDVAIELARNWWAWANDKNWYRAESDRRCSIIVVTLSLSSEELFFDCSDVAFLEELYKTAQVHGLEHERDIASLYDLMLSDLEDDMQQIFQVIKAHVPVPTSSYCDQNSLIKKLYSHYCTYIVRKDYDEVISIADVKSNF
jgi:hypothetical protein